jgi:D-alanine-D-alanine ligase
VSGGAGAPLSIVVLMGGSSDERAVSLSTGGEVASALRVSGHRVVAFDTESGVLSLEEEAAIKASGVREATRHGESLGLLATGDARDFIQHPAVQDADLFFLALHGGLGEDGTLQAILDALGMPYTGSGMVGAGLAMDKDLTKRLLRDAGIPTPAWVAGPHSASEVAGHLGLPVIVKAARGGSSLRLVLAHDFSELQTAVEEAASFDDLVLFERYTPGREFTVGVLGTEVLPVGEIIPEHELFDYACKYQPGLAQEIFPADLDGEVSARLQEMALRVHRLLRLRDFSRVDFMLDEEGGIWCLEANTLPGMTANSLLPKAARAAGLSFPDLCDRIARLALTRVRTRP